MKYYFPATAPAKVIRIAAPNAPARKGYVIREATENEQAAINAGLTQFTPSADAAEAKAGIGVLSAALAKVPAEISGAKARAIMRLTPLGDGTLMDAVTAQIATLPETQRILAEEYLAGSVFARRSQILETVSGPILSSADVDALFISASQLPG